MNKWEEIRKFVESLDSSEAHYALGYIRGYHIINETGEKYEKN